MQNKTEKAVCPMCKNNNTHRRKRAPGFYCYVCKVAFRDPFNAETTKTGMA